MIVMQNDQSEATAYAYVPVDVFREVEVTGELADRIRSDKPETPAVSIAEDMDDDRDYVEIFGRKPEPWRLPLGALRLTMAGDNIDIERAKAELEELVKVLNGVK